MATIGICADCGKEKKIAAGRTICDACRKRAERAAKKMEAEATPADWVRVPEEEDEEEEVEEQEEPSIELTATDKDFASFRPGYYKFGVIQYDRKCFSCNKSFTTHLHLLRFCSRACQEKLLDRFALQ